MNTIKIELLNERLQRGYEDTSDVYVPRGVNADDYFEQLIADIQAHRCEPHELSAVVMEPGLPDLQIGAVVTGMCVASREGYWLVYDQLGDCFYAFWGADVKKLGAHGVYGSPLYCWSA